MKKIKDIGPAWTTELSQQIAKWLQSVHRQVASHLNKGWLTLSAPMQLSILLVCMTTWIFFCLHLILKSIR